ncbi:MAG: monovalent cation/H+ antiporter subunit D family protein [Bauldia sp.]|uniref:monovalent cation/H+ antiporter subunit D family protein n=1 Tax=Bauldia sp. TaxID=2575872 RepID=UPI001D2DF994|nr:monovalent cation/H+ antiporter subunit D family protein [Bauldia sp.]MCB1495188.1 monovalent cation/H+ antiporter subunit D family protein [Bauldia sp.]
MSEHLPALQVVVPLFGALLAALVRRPWPAWLITVVVSIAVLVISAMLLVRVLDEGVISYHLGGWDPTIGIEYRVDIVNALILLLVSAVAAVIAPFARLSVLSEVPEDRIGWFYSMYLVALAGLLGIAITGDAFNAFVFLEVSSLSSYALIAMGRDRRALVAAYQYLIMGTIGATFYVIGVGLLYTMTGTLNLGLIADRLADVESTRSVLVALAFIFVGISLKLALFPLHYWLPNAYAYAPSVATVFLAATATKVAIYLFARFVFSVFGAGFVFADLPVTPVLVTLSVAAIFGAATVAVFQSDVKRMFAYSSVGQIGYITLGLALATVTGLTGGLVHLLNHAIIKAAIFMGLGAVFFRVGGIEFKDIAGIGRRMPITMSAIGIACLSLIGVPGTAGFVSKWYLIVASIEVGWWWLGFLIVLSSMLTVLYVGRFFECVWFREPSPEAATATEPPFEMLVPICLLAAATVYFGIDTELTAGMAQRAATALLEGLR